MCCSKTLNPRTWHRHSEHTYFQCGITRTHPPRAATSITTGAHSTNTADPRCDTATSAPVPVCARLIALPSPETCQISTDQLVPTPLYVATAALSPTLNVAAAHALASFLFSRILAPSRIAGFPRYRSRIQKFNFVLQSSYPQIASPSFHGPTKFNYFSVIDPPK